MSNVELKKFKIIYPDYQTFKEKVVDKVLELGQLMEPIILVDGVLQNQVPAYMDDQKTTYKQSILYAFLYNKYQSHYSVSPDEDKLHSLMINAYMQLLPAMYVKTKALSNDVLENLMDPLNLFKNIEKKFNENPDENYAQTESGYSSTPSSSNLMQNFNLTNIKEKNIVNRKDKTIKIKEITNLMKKYGELNKINVSGYVYEFVNSVEFSSLFTVITPNDSIFVQGDKGDKGDKGDPGIADENTLWIAGNNELNNLDRILEITDDKQLVNRFEVKLTNLATTINSYKKLFFVDGDLTNPLSLSQIRNGLLFLRDSENSKNYFLYYGEGEPREDFEAIAFSKNKVNGELGITIYNENKKYLISGIVNFGTESEPNLKPGFEFKDEFGVQKISMEDLLKGGNGFDEVNKDGTINSYILKNNFIELLFQLQFNDALIQTSNNLKIIAPQEIVLLSDNEINLSIENTDNKIDLNKFGLITQVEKLDLNAYQTFKLVCKNTSIKATTDENNIELLELIGELIKLNSTKAIELETTLNSGGSASLFLGYQTFLSSENSIKIEAKTGTLTLKDRTGEATLEQLMSGGTPEWGFNAKSEEYLASEELFIKESFKPGSKIKVRFKDYYASDYYTEFIINTPNDNLSKSYSTQVFNINIRPETIDEFSELICGMFECYYQTGSFNLYWLPFNEIYQKPYTSLQIRILYNIEDLEDTL